jgi:hypothetical protein
MSKVLFAPALLLSFSFSNSQVPQLLSLSGGLHLSASSSTSSTWMGACQLRP